jgi:hypothetical protein
MAERVLEAHSITGSARLGTDRGSGVMIWGADHRHRGWRRIAIGLLLPCYMQGDVVIRPTAVGLA